MNWLQQLSVVDYVILGALLVALAVGWARGLIDMLTGLIVFVVSVFVAGRYSSALVGWLNRTWDTQARLANALERRVDLPIEAYKTPASDVPWHKAFEWLKDVPLPEVYKQALAERIEAWSQTSGVQTATTYIAGQVASSILSAAAFVALILLVGWVLGMLGRLVSDQIKEVPLVGTANRLAGAVAGLLQTAVVMAILIALVIPTLSLYGFQGLGSAVLNAALAPHLIALFESIRGVLFLPGEGWFRAG